jgi:hypothetical protein
MRAISVSTVNCKRFNAEDSGEKVRRVIERSITTTKC